MFNPSEVIILKNLVNFGFFPKSIKAQSTHHPPLPPPERGAMGSAN